MFNDDILLWLARIIGILGLSLLVLSSVGGVLLASRTAQKIKTKWLRGKVFKYHRLLSIIGASLFLLHPIPMIFANQTTAMQWFHIFVPFTAPKQTLLIAIGTMAAYALLIVTVTSIYIKYMNRRVWRVLHYGTYLVLALGLIHGLFISGEFKAGEIFEFEEPEKLFLLFLTIVAFAFPVWRIVIARRNKVKKLSESVLFCSLFVLLAGQTAVLAQEPTPKPDIKPQASPAPSPEEKNRWSGSYQATFNVSVLGKPKPSLGHKFSLSYAPTFGGSFDSRFEYYVDGSYNADPPGQLINNINEPKFEAQLNYTRPLNKRFAATAGILYHYNFKFPDKYWWALGGIIYTEQLGEKVTLTAAGLVEKKLSGGRFFVDGSATLEYRFAPKWNTQLSVHRYENLGQFDPNPTQKLEYEFGVNRSLKYKQAIGVSFFRHIQFNAPNDQFSFLKFKYIIGF